MRDERKEIRERRGRDQEEGAWERGRRRRGKEERGIARIGGRGRAGEIMTVTVIVQETSEEDNFSYYTFLLRHYC